MKLLELSPYLSMGVDWMDDLHRDLVELVNGLVAMPDDGDEELFNGQFTKRFGHFIDVFEEHCEREIELLRETGFPGTEDHAESHDALIAEMRKLQADCRREKFAGLTKDAFYHRNVFLFLEDAIKNDLKAKSFLIERGIARPAR